MKKTDLIKFRCTPADKSALQRLAEFRQLTLTELIEEALWPYVVEASVAHRLVPAEDPTEAEHQIEQLRAVTPWPIPPVVDGAPVTFVHQGCPNAGRPCNCTGQCMRPVGAPEPDPIDVTRAAIDIVTSCPHGRPSPKVCWECA